MKMRMPNLLRRAQRAIREIAPDEIFIDAAAHPLFSRGKMEGALEQPISKMALLSIALCGLLMSAAFAAKLYQIQVVKGSEYARISESNRTDNSIVFAQRGIIYDRNGVELAWNVPLAGSAAGTSTPINPNAVSGRAYRAAPGYSHLIGYVTLPRKDRSGNYYRTAAEGVAGVEQALDAAISGENGSVIIERDALGTIVSQTALAAPYDGAAVHLSIDARVSEELSKAIAEVAERSQFQGGAGVVMDVKTGELLALMSYPEFDPIVMTNATDTERIESYQNDPRTPFINRALGGLYTPGSIIKPFVALAALGEGVITPQREILSTGVMLVPNPYAPDRPSRFVDWRAHGLVDMRRALAVSSNIYFYQIGGGFGAQQGVGIATLEAYLRDFGIGQKTGIIITGEKQGIIPNPAWKLAVFGEPWRLGDTYNTAIGQYGFLVTPLSMARATAALANGGVMLVPSLVETDSPMNTRTIERVPPEAYRVVHEGMRQAVTEGTAAALNIPQVAVAGKTGTAQVGAGNALVNSWVIGFFPYEQPRYAFAILMERAPAGPPAGAPYAARRFLENVAVVAPEYLAPAE